MIAYLGMSDKLSNVSYYDSSGGDYTFQKPYSEKTAELIDIEVKTMIAEQYQRAKDLLSKHVKGHQDLSDLLLEKEVIYAENLELIFGERPWVSRSQEILDSESRSKNVYDTSDSEQANDVQSDTPRDAGGSIGPTKES